MSQILLGSDPEVFLLDHMGNPRSAVGLVGGSKEEPLKQGGFAYLEDNVTVEFNIPPCPSVEYWVHNHNIALEWINTNVAVPNNCTIAIESALEFPDSELKTPGAQTFGCNPDFNAWLLEPNPSPSAESTNLRTAGGHIHIGVQLNLAKKMQLIRALDVMLGVPLAMLNPTDRRNELYGNAGACRLKPYGIEYRVPSNIWLSNETLMREVYGVVYDVVENLDSYADLLNDTSAFFESMPTGGMAVIENVDILSLIRDNMTNQYDAVYAAVLEKV